MLQRPTRLQQQTAAKAEQLCNLTGIDQATAEQTLRKFRGDLNAAANSVLPPNVAAAAAATAAPLGAAKRASRAPTKTPAAVSLPGSKKKFGPPDTRLATTQAKKPGRRRPGPTPKAGGAGHGANDQIDDEQSQFLCVRGSLGMHCLTRDHERLVLQTLSIGWHWKRRSSRPGLSAKRGATLRRKTHPTAIRAGRGTR